MDEEAHRQAAARVAELRQRHDEELRRGDHGEAMQWLLDAAICQASVGDEAGAEATGIEALGLARARCEPSLQSRALLHLGIFLERKGERARAEPLLREALGIAEQAGTAPEAGRAAVALGLSLQHRGEGEEARSWLLQGVSQLALLDPSAVIARCHLKAIDSGQDSCCSGIWGAAGEAITTFLQHEIPGHICEVKIWHEGETRRIHVSPARPLGPPERAQVNTLLNRALEQLQQGFEALG